jgi:hypothetical protein
MVMKARFHLELLPEKLVKNFKMKKKKNAMSFKKSIFKRHIPQDFYIWNLDKHTLTQYTDVHPDSSTF